MSLLSFRHKYKCMVYIIIIVVIVKVEVKCETTLLNPTPTLMRIRQRPIFIHAALGELMASFVCMFYAV